MHGSLLPERLPILHQDVKNVLRTHLALACPHCDGRKWAHIDGLDQASGTQVPLFHPRTQTWSEHFEWSTGNPVEIEGITATGRATVERLQLNHPDMVAVRRFLMELGIH